MKLYAKNKKIRQERDEEHAGKINYNLYDVFSTFIKEANRYKAKSAMKHEYDLGLHKIRTLKFNKRNSKGEFT